MSDLVAYWRNEARHIDLAVAVGDDLTVEYAAKAIETADTIEQLQADKRDIGRSGLRYDMVHPCQTCKIVVALSVCHAKKVSSTEEMT